MQTPKQRPLLPTSHLPEYLQSAMTSAKSLFHRTFRVTPTRSRLCTEFSRNSLKTRIRGGGGYPTGRTLGAPPLSPAFGVRVGIGCPIRASFARVGLLSSLTTNVGAPSFPYFLERVGVRTLRIALGVPICALMLLASLPSFSQQAITDPTKLQSKNVENMQNFTIEKLYMTRNIGGTTWSPDGKQIAFVSNISGRNNIWLVPVIRRMADPAHHQRSAPDLDPPGRPTATGSPTPPTTTATSSGTSSSSRPRPATW